MTNYPWLSLSEIAKYEPEMKRLRVSEVARSPRGFLTAYRRVGGDPKKLPDYWKVTRRNFIARHMAQYRFHPTRRRWLSLVAWAYRPDRMFG